MDEQKNNIDIYNTLVTSEKGSISEYDIENAIEEYKSKLHEPNDIYNQRSNAFNGLLRHIYSRCIKRILPNTHNHDYKLFDTIFNNIYIPLCMYCNRVPNVNTFCNHLINIYIDSIYDIRTGSFRPDYKYKVNPEIQSLITKWDEICNSELTDYVVHTSSIGGMFRLKTKGFREEQPIKLEISVQAPTMDTKQISSIVNSDMPILPDNLPE